MEPIRVVRLLLRGVDNAPRRLRMVQLHDRGGERLADTPAEPAGRHPRALPVADNDARLRLRVLHDRRFYGVREVLDRDDQHGGEGRGEADREDWHADTRIQEEPGSPGEDTGEVHPPRDAVLRCLRRATCSWGGPARDCRERHGNRSPTGRRNHPQDVRADTEGAGNGDASCPPRVLRSGLGHFREAAVSPLVTFLYGMKVGETLRRAGVGDRAPSAMTSSIKHDAAEEVRPRDFSWFRRLTTIMTWPPIGGARAGYFM